ncbi:hypothetical protein J6590_007496 [Homalodisca vitripennis]|nr:hypothetical protein J6590_007496 [Homalodisca vitripennis]
MFVIITQSPGDLQCNLPDWLRTCPGCSHPGKRSRKNRAGRDQFLRSAKSRDLFQKRTDPSQSDLFVFVPLNICSDRVQFWSVSGLATPRPV